MSKFMLIIDGRKTDYAGMIADTERRLKERNKNSISIERPKCKECGGYVIIGEYCLDHTDPELIKRLRLAPNPTKG